MGKTNNIDQLTRQVEGSSKEILGKLESALGAKYDFNEIRRCKNWQPAKNVRMNTKKW